MFVQRLVLKEAISGNTQTKSLGVEPKVTTRVPSEEKGPGYAARQTNLPIVSASGSLLGGLLEKVVGKIYSLTARPRIFVI